MGVPFDQGTGSPGGDTAFHPRERQGLSSASRQVPVKELKEFWKQYSPYFVDIWQYLLIIVIFIIASLVFL